MDLEAGSGRNDLVILEHIIVYGDEEHLLSLRLQWCFLLDAIKSALLSLFTRYHEPIELYFGNRYRNVFAGFDGDDALELFGVYVGYR